MRRKSDGPNTAQLLTRLPQQIITLVRAEYQNAKTEALAALKRLRVGAIAIVLALMMLFWAIAAFLFAAIAAINLALPMWASALIVGGAFVLLAVAAILGGVMLIKRGNPVPEETLGRLGDDVLVAQGVRYNQEQNVAAQKLDERDEGAR